MSISYERKCDGPLKSQHYLNFKFSTSISYERVAEGYSTFHYITLYYIPLHYTILQVSIGLHYAKFHYTTLNSIRLFYIPLHHITLNNTTSQINRKRNRQTNKKQIDK